MAAKYEGIAKALASRGRNGDTMLMHVNPIEVEMLNRAYPGSVTINPDTGQPEAFFFLLPLLTALPSMIGALGSGLGAAAGSALGGLTGGAIGSTAGFGGIGSALLGSAGTGVAGTTGATGLLGAQSILTSIPSAIGSGMTSTANALAGLTGLPASAGAGSGTAGSIASGGGALGSGSTSGISAGLGGTATEGLASLVPGAAEAGLAEGLGAGAAELQSVGGTSIADAMATPGTSLAESAPEFVAETVSEAAGIAPEGAAEGAAEGVAEGAAEGVIEAGAEGLTEGELLAQQGVDDAVGQVLEGYEFGADPGAESAYQSAIDRGFDFEALTDTEKAAQQAVDDALPGAVRDTHLRALFQPLADAGPGLVDLAAHPLTLPAIGGITYLAEGDGTEDFDDEDSEGTGPPGESSYYDAGADDTFVAGGEDLIAPTPGPDAPPSDLVAPTPGSGVPTSVALEGGSPETSPMDEGVGSLDAFDPGRLTAASRVAQQSGAEELARLQAEYASMGGEQTMEGFEEYLEMLGYGNMGGSGIYGYGGHA